MEVLQLPGYSEEEKTHIAQKYIIPKQLELHGLTSRDLSITDAAIRKIIADYTREAGLRNLEREIAAICRKIALADTPRRAKGTIRHRAQGDLQGLLGPSTRFFRGACRPNRHPTWWPPGLAWTPAGGEILFIEATAMPGKGALTLTGLLGEVDAGKRPMRPLSYLAQIIPEVLAAIPIPPRFNKTDLHIHVPAGGSPQDGYDPRGRGDRRCFDQPVPRQADPVSESAP